jgi:P4 family phage/plasmid primase-like protien
LHVLPIRGDGSKKPALQGWKEYQSRLARQEELNEWFDGRSDRGVGILGGNGLEVLDFDRPGIFQEFERLVEGRAPGLLGRLPRVATPRGGDHLYYRCDHAGRNEKLARDAEGQTLVETRGEGGYVLAPPSPPCCHSENKAYVQVAGPALPDIPRITPAERDILLAAARSLNRAVRPGGESGGQAGQGKAPLARPSRWSDVSPVSRGRVREGLEYVRKAPLARSGRGGHNTTYAVTRYLNNDLGLPEPAVRVLLDAYNERLGEAGEEEWTEMELDHKVESAAAAGERPDFPPHGRAPANDPQRLAETFVESRPWVYWQGRHFEYTGQKYVEVPDPEVRALLGCHVQESLEADYCERVERGEDRARRPRFSGALVRNTLHALEALSLRRGTVSLPSMLPEGREAGLLGLANGLLDLEAARLLSHTPDWFSLVCLPYAYDPGATCPKWLGVLGQNLEGDAERVGLLQQFFGYALMNSTDAQRFLFLVGEGANGKSVVLAGLHAMLGQENVSTVPLEAFGQRFAMAQTLGKLVNICPEVGELDRTAEGTLKAFVSGDRMTFERKGKDAFSARPTARLVLSTNNVPRFADRSEGVWRRLLLVPFNRQVPPEERVAGMDKPEFWLQLGEAPGILNWALEGMRQLRGNDMRFPEPPACRAALREHRTDSDPCRAYLEGHYRADPEGSPIPTTEVYKAYRTWCETNNFKAVSSNTFGRQVRRVFNVGESRSYRLMGQVVKAWFGLASRNPETEA